MLRHLERRQLFEIMCLSIIVQQRGQQPQCLVGWCESCAVLEVLTVGAAAMGQLQLHSHWNILVFSLLMIFPTYPTCVVIMDLALSDRYLPYSVQSHPDCLIPNMQSHELFMKVEKLLAAPRCRFDCGELKKTPSTQRASQPFSAWQQFDLVQATVGDTLYTMFYLISE